MPPKAPGTPRDDLPSLVFKKKSIACRLCHTRKIRCSGGRPCQNCAHPAECIYPTRDRQVKIHQSYLDRLLRENEELRLQQTQVASEQSVRVSQPVGDSHQQQGTTQNPILQEKPWFAHMKSSDTPIWIGEIADAAFATRFRQFVSAPGVSGHIPRTHYVSDETLRSLASPSTSSSPAWPSLAHAKFLGETALRYVQRSYHIVRRSEIMTELETITSDHGNRGKNPFLECKLWALFAIGELCSTKSAGPNHVFPGLAYFTQASEILRVISERPTLDVVETIQLTSELSLFSLELNRRHAASVLIATATRFATIMGLHLCIDSSHIPDADVREHRNRVWWTTYVLDRMVSSKVGLPTTIPGEDISVDPPSPAPRVHPEDFSDSSVLTAQVHLARIAGKMTKTLYRRTTQHGTFLERVQYVVKELHQWSERLPRHLRFGTGPQGKGAEHLVSLQLSFNQLLIIASRPVLLFIVCRRITESRGLAIQSEISNSAHAIADSCLGYARQSCSLLSECWMNGTFDTFNYTYTLYLFSAAIILALSGFMDSQDSQDSQNDAGAFNLATHLLSQLEHNGNFAAKEFCSHVSSVKSILETFAGQPQAASQGQQSPDGAQSFGEGPATTTGWAEMEPLSQLFADESFDLSFLDSVIVQEELQQILWNPQ